MTVTVHPSWWGYFSPALTSRAVPDTDENSVHNLSTAPRYDTHILFT